MKLTLRFFVLIRLRKRGLERIMVRDPVVTKSKDPLDLKDPRISKVVRTKERRLNVRFPLGLPVRVYLAGQSEPMTVELTDVSAGGGRFRSATENVRINQGAAFTFVLPGERRCLAKGRVVRADGRGEFALRLQEANKAFLGFLGQLAGA
jgi:hypothetical protein